MGNVQIVAVSNENFGYIHKCNNKYVVMVNDYFGIISQVCELDELPSNFIDPCKFVYGNTLYDYNYSFNNQVFVSRPRIRNISHTYSDCYHVKDNKVYNTFGYPYGSHCYGVRRSTNYKLLYAINKRKIYLKMRTVMINYNDSSEETIADSHFYANSINQYSNDTIGIDWSIASHHLFSKYVRKIIMFVMLCYRHSSVRMRNCIPKRILFMILQIVAI